MPEDLKVLEAEQENTMDSLDSDSEAERLQRWEQDRYLPLSPVEEQAVDQALAPPHDETVLVERFNAPIDRRKISCLQPGLWLNDEIINFRQGLLQV
jgi:Ulp1 family protease